MNLRQKRIDEHCQSLKLEGLMPALMTDGYVPYDDIANRYGLMHLGCWAHTRRYLIEAEEALKGRAR